MKLIAAVLILVLISSCNKFPNVGKGYHLDYNSMGDIGLLDTNNTYKVYGHIMEYGFDSIFIVVSEKPRDSVVQYNDKVKTLHVRDKIFNESNFRQYWIINKVDHNIFGPFKKEEYLIKRKLLGISESLKLNRNN